MVHSRIGFFFREAGCEARQGFMTLITPLVFFGLSAWMLMFLLNADYMRSMGAVDIYRNSPHVVYLMASGQCLWLFFAWAWLFAQIVVRDRSAQLHEVVLTSPISLSWLMAARFTGALAVAVFMGTSICVGLLMAPLLVTFGALPASAIGPVPWEATAWSLALFTVPNAFATGVLCLAAASWTRSNAGAFVVAALLSLIWMLSLVVLYEGDVAPFLASVIDPSGFTEVDRQANSWTPAQKKHAMVAFTDAMLLNRGLWLLLGITFGIALLLRLRREHLALERAPRSESAKVVTRSTSAAKPVGAIVVTHWWQAWVAECLWHLKISLQGFGLRMALLLLTAIAVASSWGNFTGHIDGPLVPTPEAVLSFLAQFFVVVMAFMVVGLVGTLMRRDGRDGFVEWLDATPVPLGIRLMARFVAALGLTVLLCLVPAVASLVVTGLGAPHSLNVIYPFAHVLLTLFPAFAELCAVTVLAHALFRHAGTAYVVSIIAVFMMFMNHELGIVQYPPAMFSFPVLAYPSEIPGWAPWMSMVSTLVGWKLSVALLVFAVSWIVWRRGTALTLRNRFAAARERVIGSAGLTVIATSVVLVALAGVLNTGFIDEGGYQSTADALESDGQWEKNWWSQASAFSVRGGDAAIRLNPSLGVGQVTWRIDGLHARTLHGTLPHGVAIVSAQRNGVTAEVEIDGDHFVVRTHCDTPCNLVIELAIEPQGWQASVMPWLDSSGVWLRAQDILPTLGHDPDRLVRSIGDRERLGLPAELPPLPQPSALRSLEGVAPFGSWSWSVAVDQGAGEVMETDRGRFEGVLDFASVWLPEMPNEQQYQSIGFLIGDARVPGAEEFAEDLVALRQCVASELGNAPKIETVLQAPRKTGDIVMHNGVLWAPEDLAWQSDGTGSGMWQRQYNIANAIARNAISARSDLRNQAGARWLLEGVAGWVALRCVEARSGFDAAIAIRKRAAEDIAELFATTDTPITHVVSAGKAWLGHYAQLSIESWGAVNSRSPDFLLSALDTPTASTDLLSRLKRLIGTEDFDTLLGAPISSDVSVEHGDAGVNTTVSSWTWQEGGWQVRETDKRLLLRRPNMPVQILRLEAQVDLGAMDEAYLFHAQYGYERSLGDNRLKPK